MPPALPIDSKGDDGDLSGDESQTAVTEARRGQQRAFERAAQAVAGRDRACAGDPASFGIEIGNLESWARETGALIPCDEVDRLPLVSNHTSEHEVFYRQHEDRIVIVDAKPDNFIQTPKSLIPIDLQMAQFDPDQLELAGLKSDSSSPVIFIPR
jgi:hypothetical protein